MKKIYNKKKLELKNLNNFDDTVVNNVLFLDFLVNWLQMIKNTIEPSTYTSYNQIVGDRIAKYFSTHKILLKELTSKKRTIYLDCNSKQSSVDEIASALNINNLQKK